MEKIKRPNVLERQDAFEAMVDEERTILVGKGHDYTAGQGDVDAYHNFREIAKQLDGCPVTPYTVAMIYALKHVYSLLAFCKTGKQESGEGLRGRHQDIRNYGFILNELVPDHMNHFEKKRKEQQDELFRMVDMADRDWPNPVLDEILFEGDGTRVTVGGTTPVMGSSSGRLTVLDHKNELLQEVERVYRDRPIKAENPADVETDYQREWFDRVELKGKEEEEKKRLAKKERLAEDFNRKVQDLARERVN